MPAPATPSFQWFLLRNLPCSSNFSRAKRCVWSLVLAKYGLLVSCLLHTNSYALTFIWSVSWVLCQGVQGILEQLDHFYVLVMGGIWLSLSDQHFTSSLLPLLKSLSFGIRLTKSRARDFHWMSCSACFPLVFNSSVLWIARHQKTPVCKFRRWRRLNVNRSRSLSFILFECYRHRCEMKSKFGEAGGHGILNECSLLCPSC